MSLILLLLAQVSFYLGISKDRLYYLVSRKGKGKKFSNQVGRPYSIDDEGLTLLTNRAKDDQQALNK
jgi:hypothetical protein